MQLVQVPQDKHTGCTLTCCAAMLFGQSYEDTYYRLQTRFIQFSDHEEVCTCMWSFITYLADHARCIDIPTFGEDFYASGPFNYSAFAGFDKVALLIGGPVQVDVHGKKHYRYALWCPKEQKVYCPINGVIALDKFPLRGYCTFVWKEDL